MSQAHLILTGVGLVGKPAAGKTLVISANPRKIEKIGCGIGNFPIQWFQIPDFGKGSVASIDISPFPSTVDGIR